MLHECIINLNKELKMMEQFFEEAKKGKEFNFVIDIQPFTEKVDRHINDLVTYQEQIVSFPLMNEKKLKLMIIHLRELSVECFFDKTSKKVFIDKYKAVQHDLHYLERMS